MIRFGVYVPQGWRMDLIDSKDHQKQWGSIKRVAKEVEDLGFDSLWLYDHFLTFPLSNVPCFECWTTLSALALETRKIKLGPLVTCNSYRHPALVAKMAATLDNICNGRFELGIGAGWYEREYLAYGIPYNSATDRIRQLDEAIQIIKMMWTKDKATFNGKYYKIKDAICNPKPVQKPHPPIWVGGGGEKLTLKVVAKHANGCNFPSNPEEYKHKLEVLEGYCKQIGRDFTQIEKSLYATVIIGRTLNEVEERNKRYSALQHFHRTLRSKIGATLHEPKKTLSYLWNRCVPQRTPPRDIIGTPEQCAERLLSFKESGVTCFTLYFVDAIMLDPLRLFAEKVMPIVRS